MRSHRDSRFAEVPDILFAWRQDAVLLSKVLPMRRQLRSFMWQYYNSPTRCLSATFETGKLAADLLAHVSGLNYRQWIAGRVPIDERTRLEWQELWTALNAV